VPVTKKLGAYILPKDHRTLRGIFLLFVALYFANLCVPLIGAISHTERMWLSSSVMIGLLSLVILIKTGIPERSKLFIGLFLALLAGLTQAWTGIITFLAFLASMRMMETTEEKLVVLRLPATKSFVLGVGIGVVLGVVNLFLSEAPKGFAPTVDALVLSLNPGVSEEIIFRLFMFAFSVYLLGGKIKSRRESLWIYVLMIVPHVLLHFPDQYFVDGVLTLDLGVVIISPLVASLLFGLPMTLAMVKRDLTAAMLIHTIVDYLRFIFIGLPF